MFPVRYLRRDGIYRRSVTDRGPPVIPCSIRHRQWVLCAERSRQLSAISYAVGSSMILVYGLRQERDTPPTAGTSSVRISGQSSFGLICKLGPSSLLTVYARRLLPRQPCADDDAIALARLDTVIKRHGPVVVDGITQQVEHSCARDGCCRCVAGSQKRCAAWCPACRRPRRR